MLSEYNFAMEYKLGDSTVKFEGKSCDLYEIEENVRPHGLEITIIPKTSFAPVSAYVDFDFSYALSDKVYVNGYQSWSTSREYTADDVQPGLMGLGKFAPVKNYCRIFGDYDFQDYSGKKGEFHSYSYTYVKRGEKLYLFGSLSERSGFTVFRHYMANDRISVQKDVEGVIFEAGQPYVLHSLYWQEGSYNDVFDKYFEAAHIPKPRFGRMKGYTSWYNYYGGITEEILSRDLEGLSVIGDKADIFQIDDGYQTAVGDWLTVKEKKFPRGMKYLADKIHSYGYKAGLWLAPFNAQKSSKVAKEHPDWLIKNAEGKPEKGSIAWGGAYTLDLYHPEAKEYIREVFRCVFDDWGFDMVKLDFLYSECHTPRNGKSRGTIMTEAMEFLRECAGDKIILGCGVPLFPAFGTVDFCRISSDVGKSFKDPFYVKHSNQEIISTKSAMNNTIFRRHLDGRAFINDPDVFYLRANDLSGKDKLFLRSGYLQFTDEQKQLLAKINSMCANVLFVSDNVGGYGAEQRRALEKLFGEETKTVLDASYVGKDRISVTYIEGTDLYKLDFNTVTGENKTVKA